MLFAYRLFARIVNIAIGETSDPDVPNPTFWFDALNVATNSSVCAPATGVPTSAAPSIASLPPETAAVPPAASTDGDQPAGSDAPENSAAWDGASVTSPSTVSDRYMPAPTVPATKSAVVLNPFVALSASTIVIVARVADVSVAFSGLLRS